jgi:predicted dehydrogenase
MEEKMEKDFNWGLVGCSNIARRMFIGGAKRVPGANLYAVASRDINRTNAFADEFGIQKTHTTYEELADDPGVDCVYISLTNAQHYDILIYCLEHNKSVLCEKPLTVNAKQTRNAIDVARKNKVFLMEGLWTRCLPVYRDIRKWLEEGKIGDVRMVQANDGNYFNFPPGNRGIEPSLGGGTLLDNGIYTIALTSWVFNKRPEKVISHAHLGATGVDMEEAIVLEFGRQRMAILTASLMTMMPHTATIYGTKGKIDIDDFWRATNAKLFSVHTDFKIHKHIFELAEESSHPTDNGFEYEIEHVMKCIAESKTESPLNTLDETLMYAEIMDECRKQWGVVFPGCYGERG